MADQAENLATEETSLSEDLEATIDLLEGSDEEKSTEVEAATEETPETEVPAEEAKAEDHPEVLETQQPASPYKPPIDWAPGLKREFANLPEEVQKAVWEREQSVNQLMQDTAEDRRTAHSFNQVVGQFRGLMAAEGVHDPMQAVYGLMTTTAQLAMGSKEQRAKKITELIQHYGVDIATLDNMLAGQYQPNQEEARMEQLLNERMQPVNQLLEQMNQQRAQQVQAVQTQAYQSIDEFGRDPKHEFFHDVRMDMADFLDMAAQRGMQMSLQEAYDRACALNPEISALQAGQPTAGERIAQKEAAASSVSGRRASSGSGESTENMGIREALEASFSESERRI